MGVSLIAAAAVSFSDGRPSAQQPNQTQAPITAFTVQATSIFDLRIWDAFVTDGARSGTLRLRSVERDPALPSRTVERFEQFYQGVMIWGADMVRDSERGVPLSIFGVLSPDLVLSVESSLTPSAAHEALLKIDGNGPRQ